MLMRGEPDDAIGARFALRYFILCDEAREETTRKLMLIGVYTDMILIQTDAVQLPRLAFVFGFTRLTDELPTSGTFRLEGPNGAVLPETTFPIAQHVPAFRSTNMMIQATGIAVQVGDYRAFFRVNDATEFVGEFTVQIDPSVTQLAEVVA
jgi:hypothetical protein